MNDLAAKLAARRGRAPILPVSKNDAIFCNPILWIAKMASFLLTELCLNSLR
jgi:hypothetical protein